MNRLELNHALVSFVHVHFQIYNPSRNPGYTYILVMYSLICYLGSDISHPYFWPWGWSTKCTWRQKWRLFGNSNDASWTKGQDKYSLSVCCIKLRCITNCNLCSRFATKSLLAGESDGRSISIKQHLKNFVYAIKNHWFSG